MRGFCAAKAGFDGLSSVVLDRFCSNFLKAPVISSYGRNRSFGRAMQENLVLNALYRSKDLGASGPLVSLEPARLKLGFLTSPVHNYRFLVTSLGRIKSSFIRDNVSSLPTSMRIV
jgi:hypothetical protein